MTIVCLGWGSLFWNPKSLPINGEWHLDGPALPLEFARRSGDDLITLVITEGARVSPTLWCEINAPDLATASQALATRERMPSMKRIGRWSPDVPSGGGGDIAVIDAWARRRGFEGVVWTALRPKWADEDGRIPPVADLLAYLCHLPPTTLALAAEYIRKAPAQIETNYRPILTDTLEKLGV